MTDTHPPCDHSNCGHPYIVHGNGGEALKPCRVTRCECPWYLVTALEEDDTKEPDDPDPRRLVIEIPEGFAVTVQLVPIEPA